MPTGVFVKKGYPVDVLRRNTLTSIADFDTNVIFVTMVWANADRARLVNGVCGIDQLLHDDLAALRNRVENMGDLTLFVSCFNSVIGHAEGFANLLAQEVVIPGFGQEFVDGTAIDRAGH